MNETVDDLTVDYEENGQLLVRQLDKVVLTRGLWATIIFRYQELNQETGDYGSDKFVINRYKKTGGEYKRQSKFTISSTEQARKLVAALNGWIKGGDEDEAK